MINITNSDIELCKVKDKKKLIRLYLLDENLVTIDEIHGSCISGDITIDANSETRRSCNIVLYSDDFSYNVAEYNRIWFNRRVKVQLGFQEQYVDTITWYNIGIFVFNSCNYTYNSTTKSITVQCSDLTTLLDGTNGGTLEGTAFLIEQGNDLKKVIEDLLKVHTSIKDYHISTIGEYGCLQDKSLSWKQNRMDTGSTLEVCLLQEKDGTDYLSGSPYTEDLDDPNYVDKGTWHVVPYDLEFSSGATMYEMITKIRDLYAGYESYFDQDGQFVIQLIPTCENDPIIMDYFDFEDLLIDENITVDFTTVKNATLIYGKSIEVDRYASAENIVLSPYEVDGELKGYKLEINLEKFILTSNLKVGFQMPEIDESYDTTLPLYLYINHYESDTVSTPYTISCTTRENSVWEDNGKMVSETLYNPIPLSHFLTEESYSFKYVQNQDTFMYLGMYQIEAYVEDLNMESPFAVQKIGQRLQVLSGGEYDDITDNVLAKERAEYENWLAGRFNDTVTITTVIIPFLDVNQKVRYRTKSTNEIGQYIIKSISFSFEDNTCSITMQKFYDLYPFILSSNSNNLYKPYVRYTSEDEFTVARNDLGGVI